MLKLERVHTSDVMLSLLASEQNSRDANQSVFTPASRLNVRTTSWGIEKTLHDGPSWSLVHSRNEFVEPALAMLRACVQSEVLLASNSVEPGRPTRATSYVPVCGATTVIAMDPEDLKKTSLVEGTTPTAGLSVGAKRARVTTSHGGGGWLGEGGGTGRF